MFPFYSIILDVAIALILVFFIVRGAKRGFVKTISGVLALVTAFILAGFLARLLSPFVANIIQPNIYDRLMESCGGMNQAQAASALSDMQIFGVSVADTEVFKNALDTVNTTVEAAMTAISQQIADTVAYFGIAAVAFISTLILAHLILKAIDLAAKLPVLNAVNGFLGLIVGAFAGLAIVYILVFIVRTFTAYVPPDVSDSTVLFKIFANANPFSLIKG